MRGASVIPKVLSNDNKCEVMSRVILDLYIGLYSTWLEKVQSAAYSAVSRVKLPVLMAELPP